MGRRGWKSEVGERKYEEQTEWEKRREKGKMRNRQRKGEEGSGEGGTRRETTLWHLILPKIATELIIVIVCCPDNVQEKYKEHWLINYPETHTHTPQ